MNKKYIDLWLTPQGDFILDSGNEPLLCHNKTSISQDIRHAIIESGLATQLIAERSPTLRADIMTELELLVETDQRITPGSVTATDESLTRIFINAQTEEFGSISFDMDFANE